MTSDVPSAVELLSRFPAVARSRPLPAAPDRIDAAEFIERYVKRCQPVVFRGAVKNGTACRNWSVDYLEQLIVPRFPKLSGVLEQPLRENSPIADRMELIRSSVMTSRELFDRLRASSKDSVFVYSLYFAKDGPGKGPVGVAKKGLEPPPSYPLPELERDLEDSRFLDLDLLPNEYSTRRMFLYKNSYTDWHYHLDDETLTAQIFGAKEMLLLPPTEDVWELMNPFFQHGGMSGGDCPRAELMARLQPYRVVLEPGDVIYIPVYWWHAVAGHGAGATVAECFASRPEVTGDLRYPAARGRTLRELGAGEVRTVFERLKAWLISDQMTSGRWPS